MTATEVLLKERAALCDTLREVRTERTDVVRRWVTLDLAAHLVAREARSDAAIGLVVPAARQAPPERDGPVQGAGLRRRSSRCCAPDRRGCTGPVHSRPRT